MHKSIGWLIALFSVGLVFGVAVGFANPDSRARDVITYARNFGFIPIAVAVAYRSTKTLGSGLFYCYLQIACGVITAFMIIYNFGSASSELHTGQQITVVRIVDFISPYGGIAAGLLLFCLGFGGKPLMPRWLCVLLAGFCCVGQAATLSRSDWLAITAGALAALAVMPSYSWSRKLTTAALAAPVIAAFVFVAMYATQVISHRDVFGQMQKRVISILPGEHEGVRSATATRLTGTFQELDFWVHSPVWGQGFGIQSTNALNDWQAMAAGFRHNTWTSTLAETGLIGFAGMLLLCFGQVVVGARMIRARVDRRAVLIGALGVVTGCHMIVHGLCTQSFNVLRNAIPLALTFGVVMRTRAIERTLAAMYSGYLPEASAGGGAEEEPLPPLVDLDSFAPAHVGH